MSVDGIKLENFIKKQFENAGWKPTETKKNNRDYTPDFILYKNNRQVGYVETYFYMDNKITMKRKVEKLMQIKSFLAKETPSIFILTDGTIFHVSINGSDFIEQYYIPRANSAEYKDI